MSSSGAAYFASRCNAKAHSRSGSRWPCFANSIMSLATSCVAGSLRSTNLSLVTAASNAAPPEGVPYKKITGEPRPPMEGDNFARRAGEEAPFRKLTWRPGPIDGDAFARRAGEIIAGAVRSLRPTVQHRRGRR
jgi:hypothetical protein